MVIWKQKWLEGQKRQKLPTFLHFLFFLSFLFPVFIQMKEAEIANVS